MRLKKITFLILSALVIIGFLSDVNAKKKNSKVEDSYYKIPPTFRPFPSTSDTKAWDIKNFGPVGIGILLKRPGFTMVISNVEEGSPAAKTGKLKKDQIIESINGQILKDKDPREILGDIITKAEATDGKINLKVKDVGNVLVQIPVMGSYSNTWPVNCSKSDKIVRKIADLLGKQEKPKWGSILFLLSTGEEKDLDVVRNWMKNIKTTDGYKYPWHKGYLGPGFCEYYLRTGDKNMLPVIKKMTDELKVLMYNGAWSGRGHASFTYGQMNAAGVHCVTFLLLAKYCGVDVDEYMLQTALRQFYRFAGHGTVPYGDHLPEKGFRDNGKTGGLAVAMSAAALLTPEGEKSVYANVRDNSAMKSFYGTNWFHAAHTGGGIGEIWHNAAMSMMHEKRPKPYRSYLDTRRWIMELSRRHDGGIGIAGVTDSYDVAAGKKGERAWGNFFALTYTIPRKKLQLFGAPKSPYAKNFKLPTRPWGNALDDIFQSPLPAKHPSISMKDLMNETVESNVSIPIINLLGDPKVSDNVLLKYLHHPESGLRELAIRSVVANGREHMVVPLLKSSDPRVRNAGTLAIAGMFKGKALAEEKITPEMIELVGKMVDDPDESWWVAQDAIYALKRGGPKAVAKHKGRLLEFLKRDEWWFKLAALDTLSIIAADKAHYKELLPAIAEEFGKTKRVILMNSSRDFSKRLSNADPEVKAFAAEHFKKAFINVPDKLVDDETGYVMMSGSRAARSSLAGIITKLPGGEEVGRTEPKMTSLWKTTGKDEDMYIYSGTFTPNKDFVGKWLQLTTAAKPEDVAKRLQGKAKAKGKKVSKKKPKKTYLTLNDNGSVGKGKLLFWSNDMLIDNGAGEARKMKFHSINGKKYLLVEKGGFEKEDTLEDWHCGYYVYERAN